MHQRIGEEAEVDEDISLCLFVWREYVLGSFPVPLTVVPNSPSRFNFPFHSLDPVRSRLFSVEIVLPRRQTWWWMRWMPWGGAKDT